MTAPYSPEVREVLRKAGMSENSELTLQEWRRANETARYHRDHPDITRDQLYRMIRPKRDDE